MDELIIIWIGVAVACNLRVLINAFVNFQRLLTPGDPYTIFNIIDIQVL